MPYAQINYKQYVGNSHLGIDEIGCFDTAFSNLLEKKGITEDPEQLNVFFTQHDVYSYDFADKSYDDLRWNSITHFRPQVLEAISGGPGFPNNDFAIVEFRYKGHAGYEVTHFCCVNHAADKSIIDSWDGKVKTPAQYEAYYGNPVAWATYAYHTEQTTPAAPMTHSAPVSAPKAVIPPPTPYKPAPTAPKQLTLPKTNKGKYYGPWHVYKPGGPYTIPYAIGAINVFKNGPITYEILGSPIENVYLINTKDYGEVAIYAGPDTLAEFPGVGHGEGESITGTQANIEIVPAPAAGSAPMAQGVETPQLVTFNDPMYLVTQKNPTDTFEPTTGEAIGLLPVNSKFKAIGKYETPQRTYFTNGQLSVNSVDVAPDTNPDSEEQKVDVRVIHTAPDAWKDTYQDFIGGPATYKAKNDVTLHDHDGLLPDTQIPEGNEGTLVGKFQKDNNWYYLSKTSKEQQDDNRKGPWYGFPVHSFKRVNDPNDDLSVDDLFDPLAAKYNEEAAGYGKQKVAAAAGTSVGLFNRLRGKKA